MEKEKFELKPPPGSKEEIEENEKDYRPTDEDYAEAFLDPQAGERPVPPEQVISTKKSLKRIRELRRKLGWLEADELIKENIKKKIIKKSQDQEGLPLKEKK